ncbi:MAG TPA: hypothetical protein VEK08_23560 [Planctomycetota bacterium]|nr:hypothetical protein [Planctomycetota bacterium]
MNDEFDDLEAELRRFTPAAPSAGLCQRIGSELDSSDAARDRQTQGSSIHRNHSFKWMALAAAAAVAAAVTLYVLKTQTGTIVVVTPEKIETVQRPTLWNYRQLSASAPEEFEKLLEDHAATLLPSTPDSQGLGGLLAPATHPAARKG